MIQQHEVATDRQVEFIRDLLDHKNLFSCPEFFDRVNAMDKGEYAQYIESLKQQVTNITKKRASSIIDKLLKLPDEETEKKPASSVLKSFGAKVEPGRYAITMDHPNYNVPQIKFFRVDRPTEGRWAGYTFVNEYASDETYPVRGARAREVLAKIAAEPEEAMRRYGQLIGSCGKCGRTLTDPLSREIGIGPVCRGQEAA